MLPHFLSLIVDAVQLSVSFDLANHQVSKAIKHATRPPPPKPLPPKGAPPPPPGVPEVLLAMQPAARALSDAMTTASATAVTAAQKSSSMLLPTDSTQKGGGPTAAATNVRPEKTSNRFQVPISPVKESSPALDAAYAAQSAAMTAHDTTLAAASAGVDGSVALTQAVNEVVFVASANAALREAELAAEATNLTLSRSLGLLKQVFD